MSKRDTDCIKYVLNEMDPAERIEFERKCKEDPDLLIEVESIRRMKRKLTSLPLLHPPEDLTHLIFEKSGNYRAVTKRKIRNRNVSFAALVMIIGLSGGILFLGESDDFSDQINRTTIENSPIQQSTVTKTNNRIQPWVDNNQVIHFTGESNQVGFSVNDSSMPNNYPLLQPVNNPSVKQYFHRNLHLTGSGN